VLEARDGGHDLVATRVSFSIADAPEVEDLLAISSAGLYLTGNRGANTIIGAAGADTISGGGGLDRLQGGAGDDLYIVALRGFVIAEQAGGGADTVISSINYSAHGGVEAVLLSGSAALTLRGNAEDNLLVGNTGDNALFGNAGADTLVGGGGRDTMAGGAGADLFRLILAADSPTNLIRDQIQDFTAGEDRIDLSAIQAVEGAAADEAFVLIGDGRFTRRAGELRVMATETALLVQGDTTGDGVADLHLLVMGAERLTAADFLL
jgi:Ca2+-binding RTX toxin-like protein